MAIVLIVIHGNISAEYCISGGADKPIRDLIRVSATSINATISSAPKNILLLSKKCSSMSDPSSSDSGCNSANRKNIAPAYTRTKTCSQGDHPSNEESKKVNHQNATSQSRTFNVQQIGIHEIVIFRRASSSLAIPDKARVIPSPAMTLTRAIRYSKLSTGLPHRVDAYCISLMAPGNWRASYETDIITVHEA